MIDHQDRARIGGWFTRELIDDVRIVHFTSPDLGTGASASPLVVVSSERSYYRETRDIVVDLASLSPKVRLDMLGYVAGSETAARYNVDKIPCTIVLGTDPTRHGLIRYFGVPSGYQFSTLVQAVIDVSRGRTDMPLDMARQVEGIQRPLRLEVFVTPV